MLLRPVHALRPHWSPVLRAAELPRQDYVEGFHLLLGPLDAGAHHRRREAALEALYCVVNYREIHKRQLPDVQVKIALEDALPRTTSSACLSQKAGS